MASLHVSVMLIVNPAPVFPSPSASWLLASQFLSGREEGEETSGETTKARRTSAKKTKRRGLNKWARNEGRRELRGRMKYVLLWFEEE